MDLAGSFTEGSTREKSLCFGTPCPDFDSLARARGTGSTPHLSVRGSLSCRYENPGFKREIRVLEFMKQIESFEFRLGVTTYM